MVMVVSRCSIIVATHSALDASTACLGAPRAPGAQPGRAGGAGRGTGAARRAPDDALNGDVQHAAEAVALAVEHLAAPRDQGRAARC